MNYDEAQSRSIGSMAQAMVRLVILVTEVGHGDSFEDHIEDWHHDDVDEPVSNGRRAADKGVDVKPVLICQEVVAMRVS